MRHPRMCALTNGIQQPVHSAPSVFPAKVGRSYTQNEAQKDHLQRMATGDLFEHNTYHVMALGCLKKKKDEQF